MAKQIRPTHLEKKNVFRHFAIKWSTSARVDFLLSRKANKGLLIGNGFPVPLITADLLGQWFGPQSFSQHVASSSHGSVKFPSTGKMMMISSLGTLPPPQHNTINPKARYQVRPNPLLRRADTHRFCEP